jgi:hypothetical protein
MILINKFFAKGVARLREGTPEDGETIYLIICAEIELS